MAAYEAAMARRQLAPFSAVCFVGIDDTLLSHPLGREADASSALHEVTTHRTPP